VKFKRMIATAAATVATAAGTMFLAAPEALAYGPSYCNSSTCSLANGPSVGQIYFEMPRGSGVKMLCWTDNQWYKGTNRWFKVQTDYGSGYGYMIATQVSNQTSVPHC
jgi:hypothetical protein